MDFLEELEKGKKLLCKKHDCKDFYEYSLKFGLIEEETAPFLLFFKRTVGYKRDIGKTLSHIYSILKA